MVVIFLLLGAAVFAWPVVSGLTGGSSRERDRRLRYVAQHPDRVNTGDIGKLLSRELDRTDVDMVLERAQSLGIKPWTMYSWIQRFDVPSLAVVVAAELSHEELLGHLANETMPDLRELELFASINGLPAAPRPTPARTAAPRAALAGPSRTAPADRTAKVWTSQVRTPVRPAAATPPVVPPAAPVVPPVPTAPAEAVAPATSKMPTIFEPGSWPYDQFGSDLPEWPEVPGDPGPLAA
jgi:hypothetical protein